MISQQHSYTVYVMGRLPENGSIAEVGSKQLKFFTFEVTFEMNTFPLLYLFSMNFIKIFYAYIQNCTWYVVD